MAIFLVNMGWSVASMILSLIVILILASLQLGQNSFEVRLGCPQGTSGYASPTYINEGF